MESGSGRLYSAAEAAAELGISAQGVRKAARTLGLGQRVGRSLVLTEADLEALRRRKTTPGPAPRQI